MTVVWQQQWISYHTMLYVKHFWIDRNILTKINLWVTRTASALFAILLEAVIALSSSGSCGSEQRAFLCLHTTPPAAPSSETEFLLPAFLAACFLYMAATWDAKGVQENTKSCGRSPASPTPNSSSIPLVLLTSSVLQGQSHIECWGWRILGITPVLLCCCCCQPMCFWGIIQAANALD